MDSNSALTLIYIAFSFIFVIIVFVVGYKTGKITRDNIINWLLYQVTLAEKDLGSGTGKLKLGQVYNSFVQAFPIISKFVPFIVFSNHVDIALDQMKQMLSQNVAAKSYVDG